MSSQLDRTEAEKARILLALLESVDRDGGQSQRRLAADLGIALGLVNAYLKRCIKKGMVKIKKVPSRRYAYYLTAHGFSEKSRLTVEYLSTSFSFFRRAKSDCSIIFETARVRGYSRIVLAGVSDLAEITAICALESKMKIVAAVDPDSDLTRFIGFRVVQSYSAINDDFDAVVVTDLKNPRKTSEDAIERFGVEHVIVPNLLGVRIRHKQEVLS
jgi:DNA-binding MarR family transcriptional regulator